MTIRPATNTDLPAIRELIFAVLAEFDLQPDPAATDADLDDIESTYHHDGGSFDVVESDTGDIIGTVGLYPIDATHAELRKMYLAPAAADKASEKNSSTTFCPAPATPASKKSNSKPQPSSPTPSDSTNATVSARCQATTWPPAATKPTPSTSPNRRADPPMNEQLPRPSLMAPEHEEPGDGRPAHSKKSAGPSARFPA